MRQRSCVVIVCQASYVTCVIRACIQVARAEGELKTAERVLGVAQDLQTNLAAPLKLFQQQLQHVERELQVRALLPCSPRRILISSHYILGLKMEKTTPIAIMHVVDASQPGRGAHSTQRVL